jgi:hypothetical protein
MQIQDRRDEQIVSLCKKALFPLVCHSETCRMIIFTQSVIPWSIKQSGNMSRHKFKTKQIKCPKKGDLKKTHAPLAKNGT